MLNCMATYRGTDKKPCDNKLNIEPAGKLISNINFGGDAMDKVITDGSSLAKSLVAAHPASAYSVFNVLCRFRLCQWLFSQLIPLLIPRSSQRVSSLHAVLLIIPHSSSVNPSTLSICRSSYMMKLSGLLRLVCVSVGILIPVSFASCAKLLISFLSMAERIAGQIMLLLLLIFPPFG